MYFSSKISNFLNLNLFHLENFDLGSPKLLVMVFINRPAYHKKLVIPALIGAEIAGGADSAPFPGA